MHTNLVAEPVRGRAPGSHMLAAAKFIFVRDRIHHRIQTVDVSANPHRFFLDSWINLRDGLDLRIHLFRSLIDFLEEVSEGLNAKVHPFAESRIAEIAQLD